MSLQYTNRQILLIFLFVFANFLVVNNHKTFTKKNKDHDRKQK